MKMKAVDYYEKFCSKCKHKDIDAFFDDWKNPKRKFGKYFEKERGINNGKI